jgi:polar amino acid transport system substrate-binding protein
VTFAKHLASGVVTCLLLAAAAPGAWAADGVLDDARAKLPARIRDAGVLKIAGALVWPPYAYATEDGKATGLDVDVMAVLAAKLGLTIEVADLKFPTIIPGVQTGRFDVGIDELGITASRVKGVDFVPYTKGGLYALLVQKGAAPVDPNNLCGHKLAVTSGSAQMDYVDRAVKACADAGKPALATDYYGNSAETYLAVASGRAEGYLVGPATAVYNAKINGTLDVAAGRVSIGRTSFAGFAVAKTNPELREALTMAMEAALKDGSYQAVFQKYGIPESVVTAAEVRAPLDSIATP